MPDLTLHQAIINKKSLGTIKKILQKNPDLIYEVDETHKTIFVAAKESGDKNIMLLVLQRAAEIFKQPLAQETMPKWAVYEIILSVYECLKSLYEKFLFPEELLKLYAQFIPLFFYYLEAKKPIKHLIEDKAETKEAATVVLTMYDGVMKNFETMTAAPKAKTEKSETAQEGAGFELITILVKLVYIKSLKFDDKTENRKRFLDKVLKSSFGQHFFLHATDIQFTVIAVDLYKASGNELSISNSVFYMVLLDILNAIKDRLSNKYLDKKKDKYIKTNTDLHQKYKLLLEVLVIFLQKVPACYFNPKKDQVDKDEQVKQCWLAEFKSLWDSVVNRIATKQLLYSGIQADIFDRELSQEAILNTLDAPTIIKKLDSKVKWSGKCVERDRKNETGYTQKDHDHVVDAAVEKMGRILARKNAGKVSRADEGELEKHGKFLARLPGVSPAVRQRFWDECNQRQQAASAVPQQGSLKRKLSLTASGKPDASHKVHISPIPK